MASDRKNPRPSQPAADQATGEFGSEELAPPAPPSPPTREGLPEDPEHKTDILPASSPASQVTGEFLPQDLLPRTEGLSASSAPASQATGEFVPQAVASPAVESQGTAEFPAQDLAQETADGTRALPARFKQMAGRAPNPAGASPPLAPPVGSGRFALKRFHAAGGMGEIWLAEDCAINRPVAIKKIRHGREDLKERFLLEAQITGQLEHPGVVPVHELGADESGQPFYVMRFLQGRTLQDAITAYHSSDGVDVPKEVQQLRLLESFLTVCQTVAYAHSRGVIHRDLKPDNIIVGEYGETLLLDWGLAKVMGQPEVPSGADDGNGLASYSFVRLSVTGESTQTRAGAVKGTPGYMAPETASGNIEAVDQASDIYLLGATLYHVLTGQPPRQGTNLSLLLTQARKEPPPPPRAVKPAIPKPLEAICLKAMAFQKQDRYASASALAEDLQRYLAGEPVAAYRETLLERTWRWCRRHRQRLGWCAAALLVLATALFGWLELRKVQRLHDQERREAEQRLRQNEEARQAAQREAAQLHKKNQARAQVAEFRRLADEMRFYAAVPDPAGDQAPPFYDLENGERKGREALAIVTDWGPALADLPLADEQGPVKSELYDLLLLMVQTRGRRAADAVAARDMLALLDRAAPLRMPSASYHRLRAQGHRLLGEKEKAAQEQRRADDPKAASTALDHYLLGMQYQAEAARPAAGQAEADAAKTAREQQVHKAIDQYRRALVLEPDHYWAHLQLGSSYLALGQAAEAAEALSACVALRPKSAWGYSVRGLALVAQKRYQEATADLDRAIALSPDFRLPRLNRGIAFWMQKKYDEALADFDAVLQPPDGRRLIEGAYYRGQANLERERYQEALKDFDQVVAAGRSFSSLHLFRARVLLSLGQQEAALSSLDNFLAAGRPQGAQTPEAHGRRGRYLLLLFPKLPPAARPRGLLLARDQLKKAVDLGAKSATVFDNLGSVLEHLGQVPGAIQAYSKALELEPKNLKVLVKRGWAYVALTPPLSDKAREDFAMVVRLDPTHAEAHAGLGYVQASRKAPAEARRQAGLALLHGAGDYLVLHNIACVYARLAQTDAARAAEYEDLALDHLRRAVELWRRGGSGPDEVQLIQGESAFHAGLRARPEFQQLVRP